MKCLYNNIFIMTLPLCSGIHQIKLHKQNFIQMERVTWNTNPSQSKLLDIEIEGK